MIYFYDMMRNQEVADQEGNKKNPGSINLCFSKQVTFILKVKNWLIYLMLMLCILGKKKEKEKRYLPLSI